jgi:hypothetical protein
MTVDEAIVPVAGTVAVLDAGLTAPGLTALEYGLPLIVVPFIVMATKSVPDVVGV